MSEAAEVTLDFDRPFRVAVADGNQVVTLPRGRQTVSTDIAERALNAKVAKRAKRSGTRSAPETKGNDAADSDGNGS